MRLPTIFLFDIDGTLITITRAGRAAMERAFTRHFREHRLGEGAEVFADFSFAGMTDRAIVRAGIERMVGAEGEAQDIDERLVDRLMNDYAANLAEALSRANDYRLHQGASEAIELAEGRPESALGLGTGNLRLAAKAKLDPFDLYERFRFGGFGCEHEDRATILRLGADRGARLIGRDREECEIIVIGDTPKDVSAGHAIGARVIAVATGPFNKDALREAGALHVFDDLRDAEARAIIAGG